MKGGSSSSTSSSCAALPLAQAARIWGMSESTLRRRVADEMIEAVRGTSRRGRAAWFIERATVDALLAARWCSKEPDEKEVRFG